MNENSRFEALVIENLNELKRIVGSQNSKFERLQASLYQDLTGIKVELAQQKLRSGLLGMLAGAVPVAIMILINYAERAR